MTFTETIITSFLVSGLWLVPIAFLSKSLVGNLLAKDLETLKGQIAAQNIEKQIVLARLHEKRAEAISTIYTGLSEFLKRSKYFVYEAERVDRNKRFQLLEEMGSASVKFEEIFRNNHLYLRKSTCDEITKVFEKTRVHGARVGFAVMKFKDSEDLPEEKYMETWKKAFELFADEIPPLMAGLEKEFRSLLGVEG